MEETLSERLSTSVDATIVKIDAMQPDEIYLDLSNSFLTVVPQEIYRFAHLEVSKIQVKIEKRIFLFQRSTLKTVVNKCSVLILGSIP